METTSSLFRLLYLSSRQMICTNRGSSMIELFPVTTDLTCRLGILRSESHLRCTLTEGTGVPLDSNSG